MNDVPSFDTIEVMKGQIKYMTKRGAQWATDLVELAGGPHLTPDQRRGLIERSRSIYGYAAAPGTGPEGETCGSCRHLYRNRMAKTYLKCELRRSIWTGGAGTDIKARSPACSKWERPE